MNTLGERLREARLLKGLSQEQLARACGVWQSAINKIERGATERPGAGLLISISSALDVPPAWLVKGGEPAPRFLLPEERRSREDALREASPGLITLSAIWLRDRLNRFISNAARRELRRKPLGARKAA